VLYFRSITKKKGLSDRLITGNNSHLLFVKRALLPLDPDHEKDTQCRYMEIDDPLKGLLFFTDFGKVFGESPI
ncbi:MAG: hypothetical protein ACE5HN_03190, partial [Nitrospiria bacterium]